jgi:hypothetical protein
MSKWSGLGNGTVSPAVLFGAKERKDECVRERAQQVGYL